MSAIVDSAKLFFEACETGKGWSGCKGYCQPGATFSSQTGALDGIETLEGYCDWMRDLLTPIPDGHYDLKFFGADEDRGTVTAVAVFHGTQSGPGGPVPATGKTISADYTYMMVFDNGLITHMTKIWNDAISLQQLGWV